ncbi:hypothetical protein [Xenophilus sp. Marseille-Q4582]|uniref:hypothetical protein n=1 Tax=Xenophilus sp. Marseille-Q4582 TaxID=2866600 RepID=UPI001CE3BF41|nr:hypothetical protein [Xenophilus sp. Marseille-Q4582]
MPASSPETTDQKRSTGAAAAAAKSDAQTVVRKPQAPVSASTPAPKEEPEPRFEPSIPLDGKDEEGERMMEELGRERRQKEGTT